MSCGDASTVTGGTDGAGGDRSTAAGRQVIAIDGPAGSGKSTIARAVADRLELARLDTGAMYRAVTLLALRRDVDPADEEATSALARGMDLQLGEEGGPGGGDDVRLDGEDVSEAIRSPAVDAAVSVVAAHPAVRRLLVESQRAWALAHGGGVVEGRDIGSVVFPDARLKVYLTASPDERARRRMEQAARLTRGVPRPVKGSNALPGDATGDRPEEEKAETVGGVLHRRDHLDSTRANSPLVVAGGAVVVDSTGRTIEEVVEEVLSHL